MESYDMVRMANQISGFFKNYGPDEGRKEIATHVNNFWEPRMRLHLFQYIADGGKDLSPEFLAAMDLVRKPSDHSKDQGSLPKEGEEG
jgi:formate dehydrogenase subunit delta